MEPWRQHIIGAALVIGLVIFAVVLPCVWLVGRKLRENDLHRTTALNNMTQGLCMFDAKQRLIVCNDRYAQLYNLTESRRSRAPRYAKFSSIASRAEWRPKTNGIMSKAGSRK